MCIECSGFDKHMLHRECRRDTLLHAACLSLQMYGAAGIACTPFLLRPCHAANHTSLQATHLSSTELNKRFKEHLSKYSTADRETLYGLRRGTVIHDQLVLGRSAVEVGRRLQHAKPGAQQTQQYLDTSRETGGPMRVHGARR